MVVFPPVFFGDLLIRERVHQADGVADPHGLGPAPKGGRAPATQPLVEGLHVDAEGVSREGVKERGGQRRTGGVDQGAFDERDPEGADEAVRRRHVRALHARHLGVGPEVEGRGATADRAEGADLVEGEPCGVDQVTPVVLDRGGGVLGEPLGNEQLSRAPDDHPGLGLHLELCDQHWRLRHRRNAEAEGQAGVAAARGEADC